MPESLKTQTFRGISWNAIERLSVQGVSFSVQLVLARLLTPSDFGIIAIVLIFVHISQVFVDSGFANALIQKNDCTEIDFSTVFWYNLGVALLFYILLFIFAPLVTKFYEIELLTPVLRIVSLNLILNALSLIQKTRLTKEIDFKSQSKVTLISAVLSGILGIVAAYMGFGVWALVIQLILNSLLQFILFVFFSRWLPKLVWSKQTFRFVFNFGSKLLAASLIGVIYKNLYSIVIGKTFSERELGLYSRADSLAMFPSNNLGNIISRVSYPILSKIQNDNVKLAIVYRNLIRYSSFVIFPLMVGLIVMAEPFVYVVLTEKWSPVIIILQILCIDWMLDHICLLNINLLYVKGRTDLVLRLEIVKKTIAVLIMFFSIRYGIIGMCWGRVIYSAFAIFLNTYYTQRIISLGLWQQFKDFIPYLLSATVMGGIMFLIMLNVDNYGQQLIFGIISGVISYFIIARFFFKSIIEDLLMYFHIKK